MSLAPLRIVTADEFWRRPSSEGKQELVQGEVKEEMPPGGKHGITVARLSRRLDAWAEAHGGVVGVESGFRLAQDPDTVRAPDIYYVGLDRIPADGVPDAFWEGSPDLAAEVVSPNDLAREIRDKVSEYLACGAQIVWVLYPESRLVEIHHPDGSSQTLGEQDILESPTVLPNFQCRVGELFV